MTLANYSELLLEYKGKVLTVTLNNPAALNSITPPMEQELVRLFAEVGADKHTNVVVLTGAGRAFSAGGNVPEMQKMIDDPDLFLQATQRAKALVFGILDCPKPLIAKVNGHAVGLGATLALFCDIVFAAPHAKFADPHVRVGYVAGDGGAIIWPQLIGYARAKEYLLTGDTILAPDAERMGLINHCVPAEELDKTVEAFAERLAAGAGRAIQWTKQTVNIGLKQLAHSMMDAGVAYEALSSRTKDHQEAVTAFLAKRDPKFTGE